MRTLRRNKQKMFFSLYEGEKPIYKLDNDGNPEFIELNGEQIPIETGMTKSSYSNPCEFFANIKTGGGTASIEGFGVDTSDYDAVIICGNGEFPLTETSVIWYENTIEWNGEEVDPESADFRVEKISKSLNTTKYLLKKNI